MSHHRPSHQHQPHNPSTPTLTPPSMPTTMQSNRQPDASAPRSDNRGPAPTSDLIRVRAYEISRTRAGGPGDAASDWTQAETELKLAWSTNA